VLNIVFIPLEILTFTGTLSDRVLTEEERQEVLPWFIIDTGIYVVFAIFNILLYIFGVKGKSRIFCLIWVIVSAVVWLYTLGNLGRMVKDEDYKHEVVIFAFVLMYLPFNAYVIVVVFAFWNELRVQEQAGGVVV